MHYRPEHKAETHQKIVKDASRRVRSEGITGAAVSAVMRDAGLAHGGFYKHFESKDELLIESLREAFKEIAATLTAAAARARPEAVWKAIVKTYLSLEYCDHVENGCPLPALAPEMARSDETMKAGIFEEVKKYKSRMQPFMPGERTVDKERAFFSFFQRWSGQLKSFGCCRSQRCERKFWRAQENLCCAAFDYWVKIGYLKNEMTSRQAETLAAAQGLEVLAVDRSP